MSEIQTTTWNETAASNNAATPNGWPEGQAPSTVNDCSREVMSALKKFFNRLHGLDNAGALLSTAGSSTAYTLTHTTAMASLFTGALIGAKIHTDSGATPTLNVDALGAKTIKKYSSAGLVDLATGDLEANSHHLFKYDATGGIDAWILMTPAANQGTVTSVATAGIATGGPITGSGTVTVSVTAQTAETAPATGDEALLYDVSAAAHRKMTLANLFKILNSFTQDEVLDGAADFVPYYDTGEGAVNKATLRRLSGMAFLEEQTASASAQLDFALDAYPEYRSFILELDNMLPVTDGVNLYMRFSTDSGATFKAGASDYGYHTLATNAVGTVDAAAAQILVNGAIPIGNVADEGLSGIFHIFNPSQARETRVHIESMGKGTTGVIMGHQGWGHTNTAEDTTDIRAFMSSGNIASGTGRLYGIRG